MSMPSSTSRVNPVWAEQEAEISDPSSSRVAWADGSGNRGTRLSPARHSGNVSGNPHNTGSGLQTTIGHEPFTTIDDDGNSCSSSWDLVRPVVDAGASGSTAIAEVAFNLVGSHPTYTGTFVVEEPQPT